MESRAKRIWLRMGLLWGHGSYLNLFMSPRNSRRYQSETMMIAGDRKGLFLQLLHVPSSVSHHSYHNFPNSQFIALHERSEGSKFNSASTLDFRSSGSIFRTNLFRTNGSLTAQHPHFYLGPASIAQEAFSLLPWDVPAVATCSFVCTKCTATERRASIYIPDSDIKRIFWGYKCLLLGKTKALCNSWSFPLIFMTTQTCTLICKLVSLLTRFLT